MEQNERLKEPGRGFPYLEPGWSCRSGVEHGVGEGEGRVHSPAQERYQNMYSKRGNVSWSLKMYCKTTNSLFTNSHNHVFSN